MRRRLSEVVLVDQSASGGGGGARSSAAPSTIGLGGQGGGREAALGLVVAAGGGMRRAPSRGGDEGGAASVVGARRAAAGGGRGVWQCLTRQWVEARAAPTPLPVALRPQLLLRGPPRQFALLEPHPTPLMADGGRDSFVGRATSLYARGLAQEGGEVRAGRWAGGPLHSHTHAHAYPALRHRLSFPLPCRLAAPQPFFLCRPVLPAAALLPSSHCILPSPPLPSSAQVAVCRGHAVPLKGTLLAEALTQASGLCIGDCNAFVQARQAACPARGQ
jgi:hypothetical protein